VYSIRAKYQELVVDRYLRHPTVTRARDLSHTAWARFVDVVYPLMIVGRGARRGARRARTWWGATPKARRRVTAGGVVIFLIAFGMLRYGPYLLIAGLLILLAWLGRDTTKKTADPEGVARVGRLQAIYNGLVPYLMDEHDPDQIFTPGGSFRSAFTGWEFDSDDQLAQLSLRYSPYFRDGEAESRRRVERALEGKIGLANEYLYDWNEEGNRLVVSVLPPLPTGIVATTWKVAEIEYVLGFTDTTSATRLMAVEVTDDQDTKSTLDLAPVIWRLGPLAHDPHLLVVGDTRTGRTNALRSLAAQALGRSHMIGVIDVDHGGEFTDLTSGLARSDEPGLTHPGAARVESDPAAALALLDWFRQEAHRRADQSASATLASQTLPPDLHRPLWLIIDDLPSLSDGAARINRTDPQDTIAEIMRLGRAADITVAVGSGTTRLSEVPRAVRNQARARVGLGRLDGRVSVLLFDDTLDVSGSGGMPPGRGYARLGDGPVVRLQVPYVGVRVRSR
jgi:hypothetical protein